MRTLCGIFAAFSLLFAAESFAGGTQWTWSIPTSSTGTFQGIESINNSTITGSFSRLANGFLKMTVVDTAGPYVPANGQVRFGAEAIGFALFSQPFLSIESQLISSALVGECPDHNWGGNFIFSSWPNVATDLTSATQPTYGHFNYSPLNNEVTVDAYEIVNYTWLAATTIPATCSNGVITLTGTSADRSGRIYVDPKGGSVYRIGGLFSDKAVFSLPQLNIQAASDLNGTYTALRYDNGASQDIKGVRMVISSGNLAQGDELTDIEAGTTDSAKTWRIQNIVINSPMAGFFKGDLDLEGSSGAVNNIVCEVYFREKTVIYCVGNSPSDSTKPINFAMVSDSQGKAAGVVDDYEYIIPFDEGNVNDEHLYAMALQSSGRAIIAGDIDGNVALRRVYPTAGTAVDESFGGGNWGRLNDTFLSGASGAVKALAIDINSKIYAAGRTGTGDLALNKYNSNGTIDTAFATSGRFANSLGGVGTNDVRAVAIDSSNRILIAGQVENGALDDVFVARVTSAGNLDNAFSGDGFMSDYGFSTFSATGIDIGFQTTNKIIVGVQEQGGSDTYLIAWRLNTDASFDSGFGGSGNGRGTIDMADVTETAAMAVQGDDKIVLLGTTTVSSANQFSLARLTTAGLVDTTFSTDGKLLIDIPGSSPDTARDVALQTNGKIVVVGDTAFKHVVVRIDSDGTVDTGFASSGIFAQSYLSSNVVQAVAIQSDGKILVGGYHYDSLREDWDMNTIRLWP